VQKLEYSRLFQEIANTYSEISFNNKSYFLKHPTQVESFEIYNRYQIIENYARTKGIPTESEKLQTAINGGWWSNEKENKISSLRDLIRTLRQTKDRLLYPSQKMDIEEQIVKNDRILVSYLRERNEAIGYTAEQYANDRFEDETIIKLTYKNREMTDRLFFNEDEYYYLSDEVVENIKKGFKSHHNILTSRNIKIVSATGFFQNLLFITDCNPLYLWGKSAVECTKYQIDLLINGKIIKNLIKHKAESGEKIEDEILSSPEKLVDISESDSVTVSSAQQSQPSEVGTNKVSSFVGATPEDLKKMGVKVEKIGGKSLLELAKEKGGKLTKADYLDARLKM
jgi:hypothetical protein